MNKYIGLFILTFFICSCNKQQNIDIVVGHYRTDIKSRVMGGYNISNYHELWIRLDTIVNPFWNNEERVEFRYYYETYVSDAMYGTNNKIMDKGNGDFEQVIKKNRLKINPNIYNSSEGWNARVEYIEIPESEIDKSRAGVLIVRFKPNSGDPLIFYRIDEGDRN